MKLRASSLKTNKQTNKIDKPSARLTKKKKREGTNKSEMKEKMLQLIPQKYNEFYTLNEWIVWCVNYSSIKVLKCSLNV